MRSINDTPKHLREFDFAVAQLRHAYTHLMRCGKTEFASGLISPQIKTLEKFRAQGMVTDRPRRNVDCGSVHDQPGPKDAPNA